MTKASGAMVLSASKKVRSPIPLDVPRRTSLEPTIVAATNWRCHPEGVLIGFTVGSLGTKISPRDQWFEAATTGIQELILMITDG